MPEPERAGIERFEVALLAELRLPETPPHPLVLVRRGRSISKPDQPPLGDGNDAWISTIEAVWELPYFREVRLPLMREVVEEAQARQLGGSVEDNGAQAMLALPPLPQPWREVTWKEWTRLVTDLHGTRLSWEAAELELKETLCLEREEKRKSKGLSNPFRRRSSRRIETAVTPHASKLTGICSLSTTLSMKGELEDVVKERDALRWEVESLRGRLETTAAKAAAAATQVQRLLPLLGTLADVADDSCPATAARRELARIVPSLMEVPHGLHTAVLDEAEGVDDLPVAADQDGGDTAMGNAGTLHPGVPVVLAAACSGDVAGMGVGRRGVLLEWLEDIGHWSVIDDQGMRILAPPQSIVLDQRAGRVPVQGEEEAVISTQPGTEAGGSHSSPALTERSVPSIIAASIVQEPGAGTETESIAVIETGAQRPVATLTPPSLVESVEQEESSAVATLTLPSLEESSAVATVSAVCAGSETSTDAMAVTERSAQHAVASLTPPSVVESVQQEEISVVATLTPPRVVENVQQEESSAVGTMSGLCARSEATTDAEQEDAAMCTDTGFRELSSREESQSGSPGPSLSPLVEAVVPEAVILPLQNSDPPVSQPDPSAASAARLELRRLLGGAGLSLLPAAAASSAIIATN